MLKLLLQKFFNRTKKKPTLNWVERVDQWMLEDDEYRKAHNLN